MTRLVRRCSCGRVMTIDVDKQVVKRYATVVPDPPTIPDVPKPRETDTGPLEIQNMYIMTGINTPSGDYQVIDGNKTIWMMNLCPAENNRVLPDFKIGSIVNIRYTKGDNCYKFVSAKLTKEAEKK